MRGSPPTALAALWNLVVLTVVMTGLSLRAWLASALTEPDLPSRSTYAAGAPAGTFRDPVPGH